VGDHVWPSWLGAACRRLSRLAMGVVGADADQKVMRAHRFSRQQAQAQFGQRWKGLAAPLAWRAGGVLQRLRLRWIQLDLGRLVAQALAKALDAIQDFLLQWALDVVVEPEQRALITIA
jgi:hypothetical protein